MTLTEIVKATAARMKDVAVYLDRNMDNVLISTPGQEDIYMQGDDAVQFLTELDDLYEKTGDCTEDECALTLAAPYAENLWS